MSLSLPFFRSNIKEFLLSAATKLGQGNIFTSVCQEFCPQGEGGGCLPQCMLGYTPPSPGADPPESRPNLPGAEPPPGSGRPPPPGPGRPPSRTRQTPPGADPPRTRQTPLGPGRLQHTVNERPVRILLECILVCASKNSYILRMVTIGHPIYFNFNFSMARHNIYYFLFSVAFGH